MVTSSLAVPLGAIRLSPGSHLLIEDVSWEDYEGFLTELGETRRSPRINFCCRTLEMMAPLPAHERPNRIIADVVKVLLDVQERDWEDFGSTTFRKPQVAGLEPDTCFYIQHAEQMRLCDRFEVDRDPPPDLAIESDVTSKTTFEAYRLLQVPEVWIYANGSLVIQLLQNGQYRQSLTSGVFPSLPIAEMIPGLIEQARRVGARRMLRQLRDDLPSQ
ncbi:hypothetical protein C7271_11620 [filamentous cyanobacterium CCP5]|nr:hypothetical protein C7271_11620 [filamentous cyanobacterium CCP5]